MVSLFFFWSTSTQTTTTNTNGGGYNKQADDDNIIAEFTLIINTIISCINILLLSFIFVVEKVDAENVEHAAQYTHVQIYI